jgi:hypothetical protein
MRLPFKPVRRSKIDVVAYFPQILGVVGLLLLVGIPMWFATRPMKRKKSSEKGADTNFENHPLGEGGYD